MAPARWRRLPSLSFPQIKLVVQRAPTGLRIEASACWSISSAAMLRLLRTGADVLIFTLMDVVLALFRDFTWCCLASLSPCFLWLGFPSEKSFFKKKLILTLIPHFEINAKARKTYKRCEVCCMYNRASVCVCACECFVLAIHIFTFVLLKHNMCVMLL